MKRILVLLVIAVCSFAFKDCHKGNKNRNAVSQNDAVSNSQTKPVPTSSTPVAIVSPITVEPTATATPNSNTSETIRETVTTVKSANPGGILPDGIYKVRSRKSSYPLDIWAASSCIQTHLQQYTPNEGNNQKFWLNYDGAGYYTVRVAHSEMCLDVVDASGAQNTKIQQYPCNNQDNQKWQITETGHEGTYRITVKHTGQCMNVLGDNSIDPGAGIVQFPCDSTALNQRWFIEGTDYNYKDPSPRCERNCSVRGKRFCGTICPGLFPYYYPQTIGAFKLLKSKGVSECEARRMAQDGSALLSAWVQFELGDFGGLLARISSEGCGLCAVDSVY